MGYVQLFHQVQGEGKKKCLLVSKLREELALPLSVHKGVGATSSLLGSMDDGKCARLFLQIMSY